MTKSSLEVLKLAYEGAVMTVERIASIEASPKTAEGILYDLAKSGYLAEVMGTYISMRDGSFRPKEINTGSYEITQQGREYIELRGRRWAAKWIPYILTTLIAIAALVNSILARLGL